MLAARRPSYAIGGLLIIDPFAYYHFVGPTTITLPKAALIGFLAGLAFRRISLWPIFERTPRALVVGLCAIIIATALSGLDAYFMAPVIRELLKAIAYLALFVSAYLAFAADPEEEPIWWALITVTLVVAVLALAEEFVGAKSYALIGGHAVARIAGPLEGPNQLSAYLGITIPMLLAAVLGPLRVGVRTPGVKTLATAVLVVAAVADLLTFSRAGVLSVIFACLLVLACVRREALVRSIVAVAVVGLAVLAASRLGGPFGHFFSAREVDTPSGLGTRSQLWRAALALWWRQPLLGVGAGNYEFDLPRIGFSNIHTHANSLFLQSLAEGGIVLLAAWLWTIYASIATFAATARKSAMVAGVMAASAGLAIHELFDFLTFFPKVGDPWWTLLAVAAATSALLTRSPQSSMPQQSFVPPDRAGAILPPA